jgi:hypothetical protein
MVLPIKVFSTALSHMMNTLSKDQRRYISAVLAGAFYGVLVRVVLEWKDLHPFLSIVSTAFLILCPLSVGAIAVLFGADKEKKIPIRRQLGLSVTTMLVFLIAMFVFLLEGVICLVLVAPVFLIASIVGGLIAGVIHNNFRKNTTTLPVFALLPFLAAPIEGLSPPSRSDQVVTNSIHISAPPEKVFDYLASVREIQPNELGFTFIHLIGLPKPIEAQMNGEGIGAVRTSRWEKEVWFQEVITKWEKPKSMHYKFVIPKGAIPREALDQHVEMGGEYFDLIDGGYELKASEDGGTELSLSTRFVNKSQLKIYGDLWGRMVLKDFHRSILGLMKNRAEKMHHLSDKMDALAPL